MGVIGAIGAIGIMGVMMPVGAWTSLVQDGSQHPVNLAKIILDRDIADPGKLFQDTVLPGEPDLLIGCKEVACGKLLMPFLIGRTIAFGKAVELGFEVCKAVIGKEKIGVGQKLRNLPVQGEKIDLVFGDEKTRMGNVLINVQKAVILFQQKGLQP